MSASVRAGILYFLIIFAAALLMTALRVYVLTPLIGASLGMLLELPAIMAIGWMVSRTLIDRFAVRRRGESAAVVGVVAFVLLVLGDVALSVALGRSLSEHLALYGTASGFLNLIGQIALSLFPFIQVSLAHSQRL